MSRSAVGTYPDDRHSGRQVSPPSRRRSARPVRDTRRTRSRTAARARRRPIPARYRRRRLFALGVLVVVVFGGAVVGGRLFLQHSPRFQVAEIAVIAPPEIDPAKVRAMSGIYAGTALLAVDLDAVERRIVAGMPEVASVTASRDWPSTLTLNVVERIPVALAASPTGLRLVDRTGFAYLPAPPQAPPLPRLVANNVAPGDPATEAGLAVLTALDPPIRDQLRVVEARGPAEVVLRLADGKQVRWGSPERSDRKSAILSVLMTQKGSVYDVSAPDLPTIRR